jgi:hypothetical protein
MDGHVRSRSDPTWKGPDVQKRARRSVTKHDCADVYRLCSYDGQATRS